MSKRDSYLPLINIVLYVRYLENGTLILLNNLLIEGIEDTHDDLQYIYRQLGEIRKEFPKLYWLEGYNF